MTTKEEGRIRLKIEQFSQFASTAGPPITSTPVYVQKLPWTIKAEWNPIGVSHKQLMLYCFMQCVVKNTDSHWSCKLSGILRLVVQKKGMKKLEIKLNQKLYNAQQKELCCCFGWVEDLKNPANGFYDLENDTIILEADIKVDTPQGLSMPLSDRMLYLLSSEKYTDVQFLVGNKEKLSVNKGIITTVSNVFDRMFEFDANNGMVDRVIEVPDVEPEPFRVMIQFIYAEELGGLNQDNVIAVLYAAKKYNIVGLIDACLNCTLNANGVCTVLKQARFYEEKKLVNRCLDFIDKNVSAVFETSEFLQIDHELLCELFARDKLILSRQGGELAIWNAAILWVQAQCQKCEIEDTILKRRELLGQALLNIRFPLVEKEDFFKIIVPSGLLTEKEILAVCMYHLGQNQSHELYPLNFSTKKRA